MVGLITPSRLITPSPAVQLSLRKDEQFSRLRLNLEMVPLFLLRLARKDTLPSLRMGIVCMLVRCMTLHDGSAS
jgi:hypothetical protein